MKCGYYDRHCEFLDRQSQIRKCWKKLILEGNEILKLRKKNCCFYGYVIAEYENRNVICLVKSWYGREREVEETHIYRYYYKHNDLILTSPTYL